MINFLEWMIRLSEILLVLGNQENTLFRMVRRLSGVDSVGFGEVTTVRAILSIHLKRVTETDLMMQVMWRLRRLTKVIAMAISLLLVLSHDFARSASSDMGVGT